MDATEPNTNPAPALVREFHEAMGIEPNEALRVSLIREETAEVAEAVAHLLKEFCDLIYVMEGAAVDGIPLTVVDPETLGNISVLFQQYGKVFSEGQFNEAFARVHASNMSKLVDGKPLRREDGKVLKGPNYKLPELIDLV